MYRHPAVLAALRTIYFKVPNCSIGFYRPIDEWVALSEFLTPQAMSWILLAVTPSHTGLTCRYHGASERSMPLGFK
jgi:hypothetical protein